jgi:hypothetical protein
MPWNRQARARAQQALEVAARRILAPGPVLPRLACAGGVRAACVCTESLQSYRWSREAGLLEGTCRYLRAIVEEVESAHRADVLRSLVQGSGCRFRGSVLRPLARANAQEPTYLTAAQAHQRPAETQFRWSFEGVVLGMAETPRTVCVREARGEGRAERKLFTLILADRTSPIAMHFWSDGGTEHVDMLTLLYEALWPGQTLLLRCEDVVVKRIPQTSLVPMRRFVSTGSTHIFAWTVTEDTYLALSKPAPMESALVLLDFRALSARDRYTWSVLGVVAGAAEMRVLAHDVPELSFQLVDGNGQWISCTACGERAHSGVSAGDEVLIFGAQRVAGPTSGGTLRLWIFEDGVLSVQRQGLRPPRKRRGIPNGGTAVHARPAATSWRRAPGRGGPVRRGR